MINTKSFNLSIKSYALGFILLYSVVFLISSGIALWDITQLQNRIIQQNYEAGKKELIDAIQNLVDLNQATTDKFANWDEVSQQINTPEYYTYWKNNRLNDSNILPEYYNDVSIYDVNGASIGNDSSLPLGDALPKKLKLSQLDSYFIINDNIPEFIAISKVFDGEDSQKIIGFVASKSLVFIPLVNIKQYNFVDNKTIHTTIFLKGKIKAGKFIEFLKFQIKENSGFYELANQQQRVLIRNSLALTIFAFFFYFLLSYSLGYPLTKISSYIDRLNNLPEFQFVPQLDIKCYVSELAKIVSSLTQYQSKLHMVYTNLDEKNKELWEMAHHDALTGTLNRRAFEERWEKIAEIFVESRCNVSLILFDINHFKSINDSYGHMVGDEVLKKFAKSIKYTLRKGEELYRIGGDEFATILPFCSPAKVLRIADRCHTAIRKISYQKEGIKEPIRAGIGVAHTGHSDYDEGDITDILWQADVAVYHAKKPGQASVVTYTKKIRDVSSSILSSKINDIVFRAIEKGQGIVMHYQPIIDLKSDSIDYYEALLRVKDDNQLIGPDKIFEIVDAKNLDYELDIQIFKQIANDFKLGKIPKNKGVSINVSGPSIVHDDIIEQLKIFIPYLAQHKIILEITETSLITKINYATDNIEKLKEQGFLIALDDFGSGYSSISYLSSMPVDIVKFDISLIRQLDNKKQLSIIKHLALMIKENGYILVAEGIETTELNEKIKLLGFNYGQGFLYSRPIMLEPADSSSN